MSNLQKATILIVDDNQANLLALENLLYTGDRIFLRATNGKDALKMSLNQDIDLVILDVLMPDMDGFEVASILKSNKRTRDIPIIFVTAEKKELAFQLKGYEEGAIDYLAKPLDPDIARAKVGVLLKVQLQRKELIEKNIALMKSDLLINNCADIICIIDAETLVIEEVNNAFTTVTGYTKEEARGAALPFFLNNEDRALVQQLSKKGAEQLSFETRFYCKNRSSKWLQWKVVARNYKWFVNARDVTEVKEVERIRNYLATVVKQSNDAIYIHDSEGRIISWNEGTEKVYGYSEREALNMKIWNIIPNGMEVERGEIVSKLISGEKIHDLESKRITKQGKMIDVLFSATMITDPLNEQRSIAITERDITQQKIADEQIRHLNANLKKNVEQLEAANKELESFSYSVSHDLRAPLRAIDGYSQMLVEDFGVKLDKDGKRILENIRANAKKMGLLIDDLLAFSKLGKKEVVKSVVNMQKLVQTVLHECAPITGPNVSIKYDSLAEAEADTSLIHQVWVNLISNALKYSSKKEKPVITIGSNFAGDQIIYFVKDNGAGFSMDYAHKLFNVFQRLHSDSEFEGTGIGLAIVQRIVDKHKGKVWAEGKPDEGATFYFSLPINPNQGMF